MREAKIIATIGPASDPPDVLDALLDAGMDVARLNFSHGTQDEHAARIEPPARGRAARGRAADHPAGPAGPEDPHRPARRRRAGAPGDRRSAWPSPPARCEGTAERISASYPHLPRDVQPGDRILISDGALELRVVATSDDEVLTEVVAGGELRQRQGINLPRVSITAPALTEKDLADLDFGAAPGRRLGRPLLRPPGRTTCASSSARIAAAGKVHPGDGQDREAGGRGRHAGHPRRGRRRSWSPAATSASSCRWREVPLVQKQLIAACNAAGKPVITATQMLESMIAQPPADPRRGQRRGQRHLRRHRRRHALRRDGRRRTIPVEAVRTMATVANVVEAGARSGASSERPLWQIARNQTVSDAICEAAAAAERVLDVRAIVAYTQTGNTARLVSRLRPAGADPGLHPARGHRPADQPLLGRHPGALHPGEQSEPARRARQPRAHRPGRRPARETWW